MYHVILKWMLDGEGPWGVLRDNWIMDCMLDNNPEPRLIVLNLVIVL